MPEPLQSCVAPPTQCGPQQSIMPTIAISSGQYQRLKAHLNVVVSRSISRVSRLLNEAQSLSSVLTNEVRVTNCEAIESCVRESISVSCLLLTPHTTSNWEKYLSDRWRTRLLTNKEAQAGSRFNEPSVPRSTGCDEASRGSSDSSSAAIAEEEKDQVWRREGRLYSCSQ